MADRQTCGVEARTNLTQVHSSAELVALVPTLLRTVMSTVLPAVPVGVIICSCVGDRRETIAGLAPNVTGTGLAGPVPATVTVMVTDLPPVATFQQRETS
jgi:hypothetical protein